MHGTRHRLNYTKLSYSALTVDFIRAHGLIQRGNSVIDDVTSSNVFLNDVNKLKSFNRIKTPLKKNLDAMLVEFKKNTHFLDRMEVSFKSFLVCRSAGFEGAVDVNINRDYPMIPFAVRMLESLGLNITGARSAQFQRQQMHQNNIAHVCRLVSEYNTFFACRYKLSNLGSLISLIRLIFLDCHPKKKAFFEAKSSSLSVGFGTEFTRCLGVSKPL